MHNKVENNLNFVEREQKTAQFWKEKRIFQKSIEQRQGAPAYAFYDGPPTANGKPHIGHVLTRVVKDMIPRYQTMKGHKILRKAGWDTHGLPVELEVEKKLGLDGKEQIESYGIGPFIGQCKQSVWKYKQMWEDFSEAVGFWADMDDPYVTYHNGYIESVWWALKQIHQKGLLYKGHKIVPYCPRCGTPLSSHEVAQGYKEVKERSAIVKFKAKGEDAYLLAWTTTPWTLPSNVALCVNPKETYVKARHNGSAYYMAEALAASVLGEDAEILERFAGKTLEHKQYEPLFPFAKTNKQAYYVACADYVTLSDGTGIVHIAPAFGEDDAEVGRKYGLPFVQLVDAKGEMTEETDWAGVFCKKADPLILGSLKEKGLLFSAPEFTHSYPHCWRCDTPLIYYARESWFIKMTAVKQDLIKNNDAVNWIPENIGKGRFGDWLENVQDWGISRNRYWGTPLNIWECECGRQEAIGSIEELKNKSKNCPEQIELHRPFIDQVTISCQACGKQMKRVEEVIDCWFDSGSMPFAQWHYPFENKETFDENFPADFISEAVDQTRGWFYSLIAVSTLLFNKAAYKNVIVLGHVQDANGQKMSKSKGNAVDPLEALKTYGADAIRWYFYENSAPWLPNRFHKDAVTEGQRKFMGTLWNTYAFYVLYANIDKFDAAKHKLPPIEELPVMDRWLLSKLSTLVKQMDAHLESYRITEAAKQLQEFVDELSNWYVRRSRERFWSKELTKDKTNAYMTLYTALVTTVKAAAPMIPFMTEEIYRNLVCQIDPKAPESVHLCDYPKADESHIDPKMEEDMETALKLVTLGRAARNAANIKNRQPIGKMYASAPKEPDGYYKKIIQEELNIKELEFKKDVSEYIDYEFKPNLKILGPKYGKQIGQIKKELEKRKGKEAQKELEEKGKLEIEIGGEKIGLKPEELLVGMKQIEGYAAAKEQDMAVVLDTELTEELIEEGYVREIVSKIQTMRKENGFEVMDRVKVYAKGDGELERVMERNAGMIKEVVLADELVLGQMEGKPRLWSINGLSLELGLL